MKAFAPLKSLPCHPAFHMTERGSLKVCIYRPYTEYKRQHTCRNNKRTYFMASCWYQCVLVFVYCFWFCRIQRFQRIDHCLLLLSLKCHYVFVCTTLDLAWQNRKTRAKLNQHISQPNLREPNALLHFQDFSFQLSFETAIGVYLALS